MKHLHFYASRPIIFAIGISFVGFCNGHLPDAVYDDNMKDYYFINVFLKRDKGTKIIRRRL